MNSLKEKYTKEIIPELEKELEVKNEFSVPRVEKIVVNAGMGEAVTNAASIERMSEDLAIITGQKPLVTKAKKAISNFKLRKGLEIGLKVTLRRDRMWDFLERLISIVLPRIKDFRGVYRGAFDGAGNYSLGIKEHTVFPEIDPNKVDKLRSFQISMVTSADNDEEGALLLEKLGMPFAKKEEALAMERMKESMRKEKKDLEKMKAERKAEGKDVQERAEED